LDALDPDALDSDSDALDSDAFDSDALDSDALDSDTLDPDAFDSDTLDSDAFDSDALDSDAFDAFDSDALDSASPPAGMALTPDNPSGHIAVPHGRHLRPMEIETRSFQMQNKSIVLSQCYAVTAASLFVIKLQWHLQAMRTNSCLIKTTMVGRVSGCWPLSATRG
jgi:hypothetical protein